MLSLETGWHGAFTRDQVPDAKFSNGARITKVQEEKGDSTPLGTEGTVLGSLGHPKFGVGYFVEWDDKPRYAVFVIEWKLNDAKPAARSLH
jgi:hypothetical protein